MESITKDIEKNLSNAEKCEGYALVLDSKSTISLSKLENSFPVRVANILKNYFKIVHVGNDEFFRSINDVVYIPTLLGFNLAHHYSKIFILNDVRAKTNKKEFTLIDNLSLRENLPVVKINSLVEFKEYMEKNYAFSNE